MFEKVIKINKSLDVRSIALLVQIAGKFVSKIQLQVDNKKVNAKSIMGVMSLGIDEDQEITIGAEGDDKEQAVCEIINFLQA